MEITFIWSWFSFWVGVVSSFVGIFLIILVVAISQFKKQQDNKKRAEDVFGSGLDDFLKS
jgi:uncharacterized membrane protein